jgi:hypothetical protein
MSVLGLDAQDALAFIQRCHAGCSEEVMTMETEKILVAASYHGEFTKHWKTVFFNHHIWVYCAQT